MDAQGERKDRKAFRLPSSFRIEAISGDGSSAATTTELQDISVVGLCMISHEELSAGQTIEFRIPGVDQNFKASGQVMWCSRNSSGDYSVGIRFAGANASIEDEIFTKIREIETYRQTVKDFEGRDLSSEEAAKEWRAKFESTIEP